MVVGPCKWPRGVGFLLRGIVCVRIGLFDLFDSILEFFERFTTLKGIGLHACNEAYEGAFGSPLRLT